MGANAKDAGIEAQGVALAVPRIIAVRVTSLRVVIRHQVPGRLLNEARNEVGHGRLLRCLKGAEIAMSRAVPLLANTPTRIASKLLRSTATPYLIKGPTAWVGV